MKVNDLFQPLHSSSPTALFATCSHYLCSGNYAQVSRILPSPELSASSTRIVCTLNGHRAAFNPLEPCACTCDTSQHQAHHSSHSIQTRRYCSISPLFHSRHPKHTIHTLPPHHLQRQPPNDQHASIQLYIDNRLR